jgi:voltage-gated sodium channel
VSENETTRDRVRILVESDGFERTTLLLILVNAASMGLETVPELAEAGDTVFFAVFWLSQLYFTLEIGLRLFAAAPDLRGFFARFWNTFDFTVVLLSWLPAVGPFALVARLVRVLRVARVFTVSDELREFLAGMRSSVPVMLCAAVVWCVLAYIFAVSGFYLFSEFDPSGWGTLGDAFRSVLFLSLLQEIPVVWRALADDRAAATVYFGVFYAVELSLLLNLFATIVRSHQRSAE